MDNPDLMTQVMALYTAYSKRQCLCLDRMVFDYVLYYISLSHSSNIFTRPLELVIVRVRGWRSQRRYNSRVEVKIEGSDGQRWMQVASHYQPIQRQGVSMGYFQRRQEWSGQQTTTCNTPNLRCSASIGCLQLSWYDQEQICTDFLGTNRTFSLNHATEKSICFDNLTFHVPFLLAQSSRLSHGVYTLGTTFNEKKPFVVFFSG
ncbi:hypothetical protein CHS0354_025695 [Potamilus streckersoni]|uniref:Uncharacterized protein n=1 Tax=Potamilus streckersoni TaxID=2493646 RepID=A0AAE0S0M6_9BIVA|nr:hypothetical protein CHS0354_025695 [Potamilus streckersoni]